MPRAPTPFTLVADALLRPRRFASYISGGWRHTRWAALATLELLVVTLGFIALVLGQLLAIGTRGLVGGLLGAPLITLMIAGLCIIVGSDHSLSPMANAAFWILRCLIAITPPLALFLALVYSTALPLLQRTPAIVLLFLFLVGAWLGGTLTVVLARHPHATESTPVRWLLAGSGLAIGGVLWWSPPSQAASASLFAPACAGLAVGLLRPLSYLWEAPLSLGLALAARLGVAPYRLLALHPVNYDDLCLMPLPELGGLLACACEADLDEGGDWVLRVARHLSQRVAARSAIDRIVRRGRLTHPLLFWLSTCAEGAELLHNLAEQPGKPHPLIAAYAALASVTAPESWPTVIARQRETLANAADRPGGIAMLALLEAGVGTLRADRWSVAIQRLRSAPMPHGVEEDALWIALETIQVWAHDHLPELITDRAGALQALWEELQDLEGWPAALVAAMSEHLLFLLAVERRRGAWLV
jgi:hypothetical protein